MGSRLQRMHETGATGESAVAFVADDKYNTTNGYPVMQMPAPPDESFTCRQT
jgi:hypothetical protein